MLRGVTLLLRRLPVLSCGLLLAAALLVGCRIPPAGPPESLLPLWRDYEKLRPMRAMAIAGDPHRPAWVAAMAGGASSQREANEIALAGCREKRKERRMREPCLLYASGDEVVWRR